MPSHSINLNLTKHLKQHLRRHSPLNEGISSGRTVFVFQLQFLKLVEFMPMCIEAVLEARGDTFPGHFM